MACDAGLIVALLLPLIVSVHGQYQSGQSLSSSGQAWQGGTPRPSTTSQAWPEDSPPPWVTGRAGDDGGPPPWVKNQDAKDQNWQGEQGIRGESGQPDGLPPWVQAQTTVAMTTTSSPSSSTTSPNILTSTPTSSRSATDALNSSRQSPQGNPSRRNLIIILSVVVPITLIVIGIIIAVIRLDRRYQRRLSIFPRRQQAIIYDDKVELMKDVTIWADSRSLFGRVHNTRNPGMYGAGRHEDLLPVPSIPQMSHPRRSPGRQAIPEPNPFADPPEWPNPALQLPMTRSMRSSLAIEVSTPSTPMREELGGNRALLLPRSFATRQKVVDSFTRKI